MKHFVLALVLFSASLPALSRPVVIAHRGASGYRPEHTLEGYTLAVQQGADYVEPDLVPTKDGVLVARHDDDISETTDVSKHPEFASRKTTKEIDGKPLTGWFCEDFTLSELKTLRARGRNRESAQYNDKFQVPTLQEIIDRVHQLEKETGRPIGIYPETKHPSYFRAAGVPLEERLVEILDRNGYLGQDKQCYIQSFEVGNLKMLKTMTKVPLVQLVDDEGQPDDFRRSGSMRTYADLLTPEGLAEMATYATVVSPPKSLVFPRTKDNQMGKPTNLIREAHRQGLQVVCWTFRAENQYLPVEYQRGVDKEAYGDLTSEVRKFFAAGMDGAFSNHPDQAVRALKP